MHTSPSSLSLTAQRTVVTKTDFFSSPSPTIQNIFFLIREEKQPWRQNNDCTCLKSLDFQALFLTLVVQGDAVRRFLETWFHQIPPTMSWSLIYIVLKTEEYNISSKPSILYSLQATLHGVKPPMQNKKPCHASERRNQCQRRWGNRGTLGCHFNTCGMDPESRTELLAHLYTSLGFKRRNSDANALPSLTKVSSCTKLCRGLGLCFL